MNGPTPQPRLDAIVTERSPSNAAKNELEFQCAMCKQIHHYDTYHDAFCDTDNTEMMHRFGTCIYILRCCSCHGIAAITAVEDANGGALYIGDRSEESSQ